MSYSSFSAKALLSFFLLSSFLLPSLFLSFFLSSLSLSLPHQSLSLISHGHHSSLIKLLGASLSGSYVYLVYEFVVGANLANYLRNPNNPSYTVISTWLSRLQVATDLAHGVDYIHRCSSLGSSLVHRRRWKEQEATCGGRRWLRNTVAGVDGIGFVVWLPGREVCGGGSVLVCVCGGGTGGGAGSTKEEERRRN